MTHFDPQDPRLTAFALGELTGVERAEFETHVASCAECAKLIDELKQLGELVTAGLRQDGAVPQKLAQLPLQVASKEPARRWNRRRVFAYATAASLAGVIVGGSWLVPTRSFPILARWQMEEAQRLQRELSRQATVPPLDPAAGTGHAEVIEGPKGPKAYSPIPVDPFRAGVVRGATDEAPVVTSGQFASDPNAHTSTRGSVGKQANVQEPSSQNFGIEMRGGNMPSKRGAYSQSDSDGDQSGGGKGTMTDQESRGGVKGAGQASNSAMPQSSSSPIQPTSSAPSIVIDSNGRAMAPAGKPTGPQPYGTLPTNVADGDRVQNFSFNLGYVRGNEKNAAETEKRIRKERGLEDASKAIPVTSPFPMNKAIEEVEAERAAILREGRNPATHNINTESYARIHDNPFLDSKTNPLSTFSIDVDTGSYSNVRRFLTGNQLPPPDAVRIEELLNYFNYDYAPPTGEHPFAAHVEVASAPWMPAHRLVRVGIKGKVVTREQRPAANLVFLIDVSGSMSSDNKLPLVKKALKLLVDQLDEKDRVSMVVYAGASGLVLDTTPAYQKEAILTAIDRLQSGGSTNGGAGIQLAYAKATEAFIKEGVNRVILATDGDFNVGVTNQGELTRLIEKEAKSGVFLSVLGFGMGNLKDATLEQLADKGNGTYGYIDTLAEARKVFVEQVNGTLVTIAKDVKIQIEFNPAQVASYRLIGYENRMLRKEDFNDDTKDAGEIGAGHTVTALYEVVPVGVNTRPGNSATPAVDPLKYQAPATTPMPAVKPTDVVNTLDELLTLKLRYKQPDGDKSTLIETPVKDSKTSFEQASSDLRFAASVAAFGMRLRGSEHAGDISWPQIIEFARRATGEDANGYRHEFVTLVEQAAKLSKK